MSYYSLITLIIIEILILFYAYRNIKDVFAPAVASIAMITLSTMTCVFMAHFWNINIHNETIGIVAMGLITMYLANYLQKGVRTSFATNFIDVSFSKTKINLGLVCSIVFTVLYIYEIKKTGQSLGMGIAESISVIKEDDDIKINPLIKQLQKIVFALGYIHTYIYISNLFKKEKVYRNIRNIIPLLCIIVCCIFTGVRTDIFKIFAAVIFLIVVFCRIYSISIKAYLKKIGIIAVVLALLGGSVNTILKGEEQSINNSYNTLQISAYYIGSPIQMLNLKIQKGLDSFRDNEIWGRTTFSRQYITLEQLHLPIYKTKNMKQGSDFLIIDKRNLITANVDTVFGPPAIDFGIFGMIIYIFILYSLLSFFYYKITTKVLKPLPLILYSFFYVIPLMAYYANLFNLVMTTNYLLQIFFIVLIYKFYRNNKTHKIISI